jgi:hypothetical protein
LHIDRLHETLSSATSAKLDHMHNSCGVSSFDHGQRCEEVSNAL